MPDNSVIARIQGLRGSGVADGLSVSLSSGLAFLPDGTRLPFPGGSVALADPDAGPSWRHLYLSKPLPGAYAGLVLSKTAPASPYQDSARTMQGDDTKRYVGSTLVQNNKFRMARHTQVGGYGNLIQFGQAAGVVETPYTLLNLVTTDSASLRTVRTIDLQNAVPPTADTAILQITNNSNGWLYGQNPDVGNPSNTSRQFHIAPNNSMVVMVQLSAARTLKTAVISTNILGLGVVTDLLLSGNYTVDIVGYYYNR